MSIGPQGRLSTAELRLSNCGAGEDSWEPLGQQGESKQSILFCAYSLQLCSTGMGCRALLQGIFPTQGLNPGLLHFRWILYHLSHQGSPRIGKPKNTGMDSLSLLKGVFPTQELIIAPALQADFWPAELPGKPLDKHSQFLYTKEREKKREGLLIIVLRFM